MEIVPFDKREGWIWYNGKIIPWQDAKMHVLSHGLHYASSVFEGEVSFNGKIFKSKEHAKRLRESAKTLDFEIPYSVDELVAAKDEILKKQNITDGYVRAFAWRGSEKMAISAQNNKIHTAIAVWEWPPYYDSSDGIKMTFAKYKRPSPETAPITAKAAGLYMICTISKNQAERAGYDEALMLDYRGFVAEATSANIFFIMNDEIHTPETGCFLDGITRQTIIELAKNKGIKVIQRKIEPAEIANAQDGFLTGSAAGVVRIGQIDNPKENFSHKMQPHQITLDLIEEYNNLVRT